MGKSADRGKEVTYEVEKLVDVRGSGKKKEYLVKWVGYSSKDNTWEPLSHLSAVQDDVDEFEKSLKNKAATKAAATPKVEPKTKAATAQPKSSQKAKESTPAVARNAPPPRSKDSKPSRSSGAKRGREDELDSGKPSKAAKMTKERDEAMLTKARAALAEKVEEVMKAVEKPMRKSASPAAAALKPSKPTLSSKVSYPPVAAPPAKAPTPPKSKSPSKKASPPENNSASKPKAASKATAPSKTSAPPKVNGPSKAKSSPKSSAPLKQKAAEKQKASKGASVEQAGNEIDVCSISRLLMASMARGPAAEPDPTPAAKPRASKPADAAAGKVEKKRKANDAPEDVEKVEKILAMRVDSQGSLHYQIQWKQKGKSGRTSWEPEENILDDDLVDEFEEAQQFKVYGADEIKTGAQVEVKNIQEGFQNSWTLATVTWKKGDKYSVTYDAFVDENGEHDMEKGVDRSRLRLTPQKVSGWTPVPGEIIEVNENDCWWEAKVRQVKGKTATVMFRVSDEVTDVTLGAKTRPCSWLKLLKK